MVVLVLFVGANSSDPDELPFRDVIKHMLGMIRRVVQVKMGVGRFAEERRS